MSTLLFCAFSVHVDPPIYKDFVRCTTHLNCSRADDGEYFGKEICIERYKLDDLYGGLKEDDKE